ncbi:MAG: hypothetical protein ACLTAI_01230 [Thomasclavelia sp.]
MIFKLELKEKYHDLNPEVMIAIGKEKYLKEWIHYSNALDRMSFIMQLAAHKHVPTDGRFHQMVQ